jgi:Caspase domain
MTEWVRPDRSRSRAVLIGTSTYTELGDVPAAAHSLDRIGRLLTGPLCGWHAGQVTQILDQRLPGDLPDRLIEIYTQAIDVALFYYVGHGQLDDEGQLCLGLVQSRKLETERRATTSLTFNAVRRALRASPAKVKVIILDCCFAGQATHGPHTLSGQEVDVPALTSGTGAYTLAATGPYSTAWFESDQDSETPHTYFTKHLAEIVERGISGEATGLTLDPIYRRLRDDLPAEGKPTPTCSSRDSADSFLFARNAAPRLPVPSALPFGRNLAYRFKLLDDTEIAACEIDDPHKRSEALTEIAKEASADDPDRVRRLLDDAERAARRVNDPYCQSSNWTAIAEAVTTSNEIHASRLLDDAEKAVGRVSDSEGSLNFRDFALLRISLARYPFDPTGAERTARSVTDQNVQGLTLGCLVRAAVAHDPDRAERIARTIPQPRKRAAALAGVAESVAAYNRSRAKQLLSDAEYAAHSLPGRTDIAGSLGELVRELAGRDLAGIPTLLDDAKRIADTIAHSYYAAEALRVVASAIIAHDPKAALEVLGQAEVEIIYDSAPNYPQANQHCLAGIVDAMATIDLGRAEHIARRIAHPGLRSYAYLAIVQATATFDPDRAERIAHHITNLTARATALAIVARAVAIDDPGTGHRLLENAKRIARASHSDFMSAPGAFVAIAKVVAAYDPDDAENIITEFITESDLRDSALASVAEVVAEHNPDRAELICHIMIDPREKYRTLLMLTKVYTDQ